MKIDKKRRHYLSKEQRDKVRSTCLDHVIGQVMYSDFDTTNSLLRKYESICIKHEKTHGFKKSVIYTVLKIIDHHEVENKEQEARMTDEVFTIFEKMTFRE
ncbi:MAG: hypothetical protein WA087_00630 [Candidatus Saccharimonadales bacterium]